jgi:hypothetical protein
MRRRNKTSVRAADASACTAAALPQRAARASMQGTCATRLCFFGALRGVHAHLARKEQLLLQAGHRLLQRSAALLRRLATAATAARAGDSRLGGLGRCGGGDCARGVSARGV